LNKAEVKAYFNHHASYWDEKMIRSQHKIDAILDAAGVCAGIRVLDVACGTGVLFEDYLARGAERIVGVDLSPEMVHIARRKFPQSHITVQCADIETVQFAADFDACVIYNALPHFIDPALLVAHLSAFIKPGGRLCIAHGMSREALTRHHSGSAMSISKPLPELDALCAMIEPYFHCHTAISDEEKVIVAGIRR